MTPEIENALNLIFILHADHEQNCSTSTVRMVGSTRANLFASCAAGVCALWGPLHGGANVEVLEMLERIHKGGLSPTDCIRDAKDKANPFHLTASAIASTKTTIPGRKSSRAPATRSSRSSTATIRSWTSPATSKKWPSRIPISSSASSIRTSISTAASSCGPWASPPTCSPSVRHRPPARLDCPLEGTARRTDQQDPASPADLHRSDRDELRVDEEPVRGEGKGLGIGD